MSGAGALALGTWLLAGTGVAKTSWTRELETVPVPGERPDDPPKRLSVVIQRPGADGRRRLPALIVLGGVETGARVLDFLAPSAPVVLATFEYPYEGPRRFRFPRTIVDAERIKAAVAETPRDVAALNRFLRSRDYVDPDRVCVVGASFGAPFALRAAAVDSEVRCLVLVQGFADVKGTAAHRMRQLWCGTLGSLTRPSAWLLSRSLVLFLEPPAPEHDAAVLRAGQRVLVIEARDDTLVPAASRELLWASLKRSQARTERVVLPGEHLLASRSAEDIRKISRVVERWVPIEAAKPND